MRLPSQELWTLLASASEQASGIPKKILDDKAEELRIKNEAQKAIQVSRFLLFASKDLVQVPMHCSNGRFHNQKCEFMVSFACVHALEQMASFTADNLGA